MFNVDSNITPYAQIVSSVESAIYNVEDEIRNDFINILSNHKRSSVLIKDMSKIKFNANLKKTRYFLKENSDVFVTNADKGNVTVVLNKSDYFGKMETLLNNETIYEQTNKDKTLEVQKEINILINQWEEEKRISTQDAKGLKSNNCVISKLYGLAKIHKEGVPFRPIVSSIGSATYKLSKLVGGILKFGIGKSPRRVHNSEEFKLQIQNVVLPDNYVLVSLDVVSLFTNIDNRLVRKLVSLNWKSIKQKSKKKITKLQFMKALILISNNCQFQFNEKIYNQNFGVPMGSPMSPIVADLVMEYIEDKVLSSLNFDLSFYYWFVDDAIAAVHSDNVNKLLEAFNNENEFLKFTLEMEHDQK